MQIKNNKNSEYYDSLGSMLSHELRTPLAAIGISTNAVQLYLQKLVGVYKIAEKNNLDIPFISDKQLGMLMNCLDIMNKEVKTANYLITLISSILKAEGMNEKTEKVNIKLIIEGAVKKIKNEYNLHHKELNVVININDSINIKAHQQTITTLFFALFYSIIQRAPVDYIINVSVLAKKLKEHYIIEILDNVQCYKYQKELYIINNKIKPELYFCTKYMNLLGGSIEQTNLNKNETLHCLKFREEL